MEYVIGTGLTFLALLLFLPAPNSTQLRNLPLLVTLLCLLAAVAAWRLLKYASLMAKAKRLLKSKKFKDIRCEYLPLSARLHGRYSLSFRHGSDTVQIVFLARKKKYPHYHFLNDNQIEFYKTILTVVSKQVVAQVSHATATRLVGRRRIAWNRAATVRIVLFDRLPPQISDAQKRGEIGVGEHMKSVNAYVLDWKAFEKRVNHTK